MCPKDSPNRRPAASSGRRGAQILPLRQIRPLATPQAGDMMEPQAGRADHFSPHGQRGHSTERLHTSKPHKIHKTAKTSLMRISAMKPACWGSRWLLAKKGGGFCGYFPKALKCPSNGPDPVKIAPFSLSPCLSHALSHPISSPQVHNPGMGADMYEQLGRKLRT